MPRAKTPSSQKPLRPVRKRLVALSAAKPAALPVHDAELQAGSRSHYEDPRYYDEAYCDRDEDVRYYVQLAAGVRGPVLELGVGNGRIAVPLAEAGHKVVGLDASAPMLDDLRGRLATRPELRKRIDLHQGDMRDFALGRRFKLIIAPFNTVLHLYTRQDVEAFLGCVRAHLAPGGSFVCDLSVPVAEDLARTPDKLHHAPSFTHPTLGRVRYSERFDYDALRQVLFVSMYFTPMRKGAEPVMTPLAHRQFFPLEWEALLHYNGFRATACLGDFEGGPLTASSDSMIWHATHRPRFHAD